MDMSVISTEQLLKFIMSLIELIIIPIVIYIVNKLNQSAKSLVETNVKIQEISTKGGRIEAILIGVDGKNGLRSRIRRLEDKMDILSFAQGRRHGEPQMLFPTNDEDDEDH